MHLCLTEECISSSLQFLQHCSCAHPYWSDWPQIPFLKQLHTFLLHCCLQDCHVRATGNPFVQPTPLEPKPRTKQAALLEWMLRLC